MSHKNDGQSVRRYVGSRPAAVAANILASLTPQKFGKFGKFGKFNPSPSTHDPPPEQPIAAGGCHSQLAASSAPANTNMAPVQIAGDGRSPESISPTSTEASRSVETRPAGANRKA